MKLLQMAAAGVLALGLGAGSVIGTSVANAAPGVPGIEFQQKPHHGGGWDDWSPKPGNGHGPWGKGGWGFDGIDACISATGPYGNVSGFVCI